MTAPSKSVLVLNGPNLNLLGTREPAVYGSHTLRDVENLCSQTCSTYGFRLDFRQSNQEGILVDAIHEAGAAYLAGTLAGVVFNPAAYTHTSVALHDAIKGTGIRLIELHLSNVQAREAFRHHSWISPVATGIIAGFGMQGYALAIAAIAAAEGGEGYRIVP